MRIRMIACLITWLFATALAHAGAWAHDSFANDDALDWVENELKPGGLRAVQRAVAVAAENRGYMQVTEGCNAIAACEVLAAMQGRPSPTLPEDVAAIAKRLSGKVTDSLRKTARDALDRVLGKNSEVSELWGDSEDAEKWRKSVEELKARL